MIRGLAIAWLLAVTAAACGRPAMTTPVASPPADLARHAVGDVITLGEPGRPVGTLSVDEVSQARYFEDEFTTDMPYAQDAVFLSAHVTHAGLDDGFRFAPSDWQVLVDGQPVEAKAYVLNGPEPTLAPGTLAAGRTTGGWLVFEVPSRGEVVLWYRGPHGTPDGTPVGIVVRPSP